MQIFVLRKNEVVLGPKVQIRFLVAIGNANASNSSLISKCCREPGGDDPPAGCGFVLSSGLVNGVTSAICAGGAPRLIVAPGKIANLVDEVDLLDIIGSTAMWIFWRS